MTELVGTGEITRLYGISRGQVFRLIESGEWPEPVATLVHGRVWQADDVKQAVARLLQQGRVTPDGRLIPTRFTQPSRASV